MFDYGCGHGDDLRHLRDLGISSTGWDPVYGSAAEIMPAEVVNLGYVVNVIEDPEERAIALRRAWSMAEKLLIVSARLAVEADKENQNVFEDGCLTRLNTFQKYYEQRELRDWLDSLLGETSLAAGPGVFYVFRDAELKQSFLASRFRRRVTAPKPKRSELAFEQHKGLLEPFMDFIATRGRLPEADELDILAEIRSQFGGVGRAFSLIRRVTGQDQWTCIREERSQDLLVYLALSKFGG